MRTQVYEDSAGELYYGHNNKMYFLGHYIRPGKLLDDIVSADDWFNVLKGESKETKKPLSPKLIAETDGSQIIVYINSLGISGKKYAGIEE